MCGVSHQEVSIFSESPSVFTEKEKMRGVDAGLVPRPHLGPGEPAQRGDGWLGETSQE